MKSTRITAEQMIAVLRGARRLKALEDENRRLKILVVDLSLGSRA